MISQTQKNAIDFVIAQNPTTITILRKAYSIVDGAREKTQTTLAAQVILLYPTKNMANETKVTAGQKDSSKWNGLAPSTADIRWGDDVEDSFQHPVLGFFRIVSGRPITVASDVNGYWLELERV